VGLGFVQDALEKDLDIMSAKVGSTCTYVHIDTCTSRPGSVSLTLIYVLPSNLLRRITHPLPSSPSLFSLSFYVRKKRRAELAEIERFQQGGKGACRRKKIPPPGQPLDDTGPAKKKSPRTL
jgi:hypothetical protein